MSLQLKMRLLDKAPPEPVRIEAPKDKVWRGGRTPIFEKEERMRLTRLLNAAYASVMQGSEQNWGLWEQAREQVVGTLKQRYAEAGLHAPPLDWDAFWARIDKPGPSADQETHVRLVEALMVDYQERFLDHIAYRQRYGGNFQAAVSGPTGMGKSSCIAALCDHLSPMQPETLLNHVSIDVHDLPKRLKGKTPGQCVWQDEYVQLAGEGSGTMRSLFQNLEDTLRASQVNLFVLSPRTQDHNTMQCDLELFLWNPEEMYSAFIVWRDGMPMGIITLPWMRKELYDVYAPWKAANVERSMRGQFQDTTHLARLACTMMRDERVVHYLTKTTNRPKKSHFSSAVKWFQPQMMSGAQTDRITDFLYEMCMSWEQVEPHFTGWFGVEAPAGLRRVAKHCAQE